MGIANICLTIVKLPAYKAGDLSKARKAFIPAHRGGYSAGFS
jgi:hypothetical protein